MNCQAVTLEWPRILDAVCDAVLAVGPEGSILFCNQAARELWRYERSELEGLALSHLLADGGQGRCAGGILQAALENGHYQGDFLFQKKDGERFLGSVRACVLEGCSEGGTATVIVSVRDLTEQRRLQQRILESQKLSYLEKVVDGLSHEIRNPIVTLGGYARRLEKMLEPEHPGQAPLRIILKDVERMESMLREMEDYLEFARSHRMSFVKLDLHQVVREAVALVPRPANTKLEESYPPAGPWIFGDQAHLRELFRHLVDNAVEAMPHGGLLRVKVEQTGRLARVRIQDTGVGIPEKFLPHIYSPFFTTKTKGAGVGLAKVHIIVEEHGGEIDVVSEVAKGTTLDVTFPLDRRQTPRTLG